MIIYLFSKKLFVLVSWLCGLLT